MNKKQLISIIRTEVLIAKSSPERKGYIAGLEEAINIIEGFSNEPQKPVVPQMVADWYEEHKGNFDIDLWDIIYEHGRGNTTAMSTWIDFTDDALITLVNMHQFGYTVEKEKRYTVKIKGLEKDYNFLNLIIFQNVWVLSSLKIDKKFRSFHTRKELEDAGFEWVFDCEGVEIEEVE